MSTHKSNDYKLSAVKYYLSHSKNQVHTCKIFGCSERILNVQRCKLFKIYYPKYCCRCALKRLYCVVNGFINLNITNIIKNVNT